MNYRELTSQIVKYIDDLNREVYVRIVTRDKHGSIVKSTYMPISRVQYFDDAAIVMEVSNYGSTSEAR